MTSLDRFKWKIILSELQLLFYISVQISCSMDTKVRKIAPPTSHHFASLGRNHQESIPLYRHRVHIKRKHFGHISKTLKDEYWVREFEQINSKLLVKYVENVIYVPARHKRRAIVALCILSTPRPQVVEIWFCRFINAK